MKKYLENSMTFKEYSDLLEKLFEQGKTTGEDQSEAMFNYAKLNRQRMKRLAKTVKINDSMKEIVETVERKMTWLIITEGWCGDAAQNVPVIEKIAALSPNIETRYVLRDENLDLMDQYLTNNGRSIPKLVSLDSETLEELGVWGPRPQVSMDYYYNMRDSGMEKPEMMENLQRWYISDKEQSIQAEFGKLIESWTNQNVSSAGTAI